MSTHDFRTALVSLNYILTHTRSTVFERRHDLASAPASTHVFQMLLKATQAPKVSPHFQQPHRPWWTDMEGTESKNCNAWDRPCGVPLVGRNRRRCSIRSWW